MTVVMVAAGLAVIAPTLKTGVERFLAAVAGRKDDFSACPSLLFGCDFCTDVIGFTSPIPLEIGILFSIPGFGGGVIWPTGTDIALALADVSFTSEISPYS